MIDAHVHLENIAPENFPYPSASAYSSAPIARAFKAHLEPVEFYI